MTLSLFHDGQLDLPLSFSPRVEVLQAPERAASVQDLTEPERRTLRAIFWLSEKLPEARASDAKLAEYCGYKSRHTTLRARRSLQERGLLLCTPRRHNRRWSVVTPEGLEVLRADPYLRRYQQQLDARLKPHEQQQMLPRATADVARSNNHVSIIDLKSKLTLVPAEQKPRRENRRPAIQPQVRAMTEKKPEPKKDQCRPRTSVVTSGGMWAAAKDKLRSQLPAHFFDQFIEPLEEAKAADGALILIAENAREKTRIETRYRAQILAALRDKGFMGDLRIVSNEPVRESATA